MTEAGIAVRTLRIDYFLDVICPWCWIGLRNLRTALDLLSAEQPDTAVQIVWHANTLQPQIPAEGVSFQAFYEARLGGKEAVEARRAQVRSFAEPVGIQLNYAAIQYFPNSRLACALVNTAQSQLNTQDMLAFVESIFSAYFTQGQNIGDLQTLQSLAKAAKVEWNPELEPKRDPLLGSVRPEGVPFYVFDAQWSLSGAVPPQDLLSAANQAMQLASSHA